jgi:hypothetical protein
MKMRRAGTDFECISQCSVKTRLTANLAQLALMLAVQITLGRIPGLLAQNYVLCGAFYKVLLFRQMQRSQAIF